MNINKLLVISIIYCITACNNIDKNYLKINLDNATDSKIVKKSHKMMLFSNKINELCFNFIEKSKFS